MVGSVLKILGPLRELYAMAPEAKAFGIARDQFSFNRSSGWCSECRGLGSVVTNVRPFPKLKSPCPQCGGARLSTSSDRVRFKGVSFRDVLSMSAERVLAVFEAIPNVAPALRVLVSFGLGYLPLGQATVTLSSGERQRLHLASVISNKRADGKVFFFDEPSRGLHLDDIETLREVFQTLVDSGATIVAVEHRWALIRSANHVVELGPGAGKKGGQVIAEGTTEQLLSDQRSTLRSYVK